MQLNFNPLNGSYGSKPFNPLNYNAINQQAQPQTTGGPGILTRPPQTDPLATYKQAPWANPLQANQPRVTTPLDFKTDLPALQPPPEPNIDVNGIMGNIDANLANQMKVEFNDNVSALAGDDDFREKMTEDWSSTASADMGMENKLMGVGGAALGVYNAIQGNKAQQEELRRREIEVEQAIGQNASEREKIELMNPNANMRAKMAMMQSGKSAAMQQAANVGGANVTSSGLGGDVGSAKIAAMKASAPMAQAGSAYDMQMAGAIDQRAGEENQQIQQLSNNTMQRGQLSQMTDYIQQEKNKNPLDGILSAALSGATGGNIMGTLLGGEDNLTSLGKKKNQTLLMK